MTLDCAGSCNADRTELLNRVWIREEKGEEETREREADMQDADEISLAHWGHFRKLGRAQRRADPRAESADGELAMAAVREADAIREHKRGLDERGDFC